MARDTDAFEYATADRSKIINAEHVDEIMAARASSEPARGHKQTKLAAFDLMPWDALWALAEHYGRGQQKYPTPVRNWEHGYEWSKSFSALQRHAAAFWQGQDVDPDPPHAPHAAAMAWHALALLTCYLRGMGVDDRPVRLESIAPTIATGLAAMNGQAIDGRQEYPGKISEK